MLAKLVMFLLAVAPSAAACPLPLVGDEFVPPYWDDWNQQWSYFSVSGEFGRDYRYQVMPANTTPGPDWYLSSFDHSGWQIGESAFSSMAEIDLMPTRTSWEAGTDLFLFKTFWKGSWVPYQTLTSKVAVADSYDLYLNGVLVASGGGDEIVTHWEYIESIPSSQFHAGTNELGIMARSRGAQSGFDFVLWSVPEPGGWLMSATGVLALFVLYTISSRRGSHFTLVSRR